MPCSVIQNNEEQQIQDENNNNHSNLWTRKQVLVEWNIYFDEENIAEQETIHLACMIQWKYVSYCVVSCSIVVT